MPFIRYPGIEGLFWVPEETPPDKKKHNCPDCHHCQVCNDDKCRLCRQQKSCKKECAGSEIA